MSHDERPLRILLMVHTPWSRNLGGPQAQMGLGEELSALGDHVEKFSLEDAFHPRPPARPRSPGRLWDILASNRSFAARAAAFVRAHGDRFDVIDANQTDLPFPKATLGFSGLLVARSVGLIPAYEDFEKMVTRRWPQPVSARELAWRALTFPGRRRRLRDVERSFRHADLINVSNTDDREAVARGLGYGDKVVYFPFGLSGARREALRRALAEPAERLAQKRVAFIGSWNPRKGSRDWPEIVRRVRARVPAARFRLLGTGQSPDSVLRDFQAEDRPALEIIPRYESLELPGLLSLATVGAFPGYLEGFGFSVLEKLAAGLPTVAYDAPGPRDILRRARLSGRIGAGDVESFADAVIERLLAPVERYKEESDDGLRAAATFCWAEIARDTRQAYCERLEKLRPEGRP